MLWRGEQKMIKPYRDAVQRPATFAASCRWLGVRCPDLLADLPGPAGASPAQRQHYPFRGLRPVIPLITLASVLVLTLIVIHRPLRRAARIHPSTAHWYQR
jgi:hypothetical protein